MRVPFCFLGSAIGIEKKYFSHLTALLMSEGIEAQRAKSGLWYSEDVNPGVKLQTTLKSILLTTKSEFQQIDVIDTHFGRTLVTDGKTQSAQLDEFAYHESLVHPPLLKSALLAKDFGKPRSVFIGGGGELATAREVLRHGSVERLVMVDLDKKVIDVCKEFLPEWGGEDVASNPRLDLVIGNAHAYLMNTSEKFDVIIMDISDPIEAGPGIMLYTQEFYAHAKTLLNSPNGVFVTQSGCADSIPAPFAVGGEHDTACYGPIINTLGTVFDCVVPYSTNIPSFGGDWGFTMAFNAPRRIEGDIPDEVREELITGWTNASNDVIDGLLDDHIGCDVLKYYDGETHKGMFSLTKPLRTSLKEDKRIMTKDNPIFMY